MPLKKHKRTKKHIQRSKRTHCTHSQHWHDRSPTDSFSSYSAMAMPGSSETSFKPTLYGNNDQIWQYVVMKYIYGLMNGQPRTMSKPNLNSYKPKVVDVIKKDKSVGNIATESLEEKPIVYKIEDNSADFLKHISVSTETSSESTSDISSPEKSIISDRSPVVKPKITNAIKNTIAASFDKNLSANKAKSPATAATRSEKVHQGGDGKAKNDKEEVTSGEESDDDESSEEETTKEPSWQTILQMMKQFGMMQSLGAGGSKLPMPF